MSRVNDNFQSSGPSVADVTVEEGAIPVRVVDIILDESHPSFENYGDIGAIRYRALSETADEDSKQILPKAFPMNRSVFTFPFINEVVYISSGPEAQDKSDIDDAQKTYYSSPLAIWNHCHFNAHPNADTYAGGGAEMGTLVEERGDVAPLLPFPGDTLIEGRYGQSIRFSGSPANQNPFTVQENLGDPITIIRNGRPNQLDPVSNTGDAALPDGYTPIVEDINIDPTSIYLTSNHRIPLDLANDRRDSYLRQFPIKANAYQGAQAIINSDRVVINSKKDHTIITGNESVSLASDAVHLDANRRIVLDSRKIFLGRSAYAFSNSPRRIGGMDGIEDIQQPVVKGGKLEEVLFQILATLRDLIDAMSFQERANIYVPNLIAAATAEKEAIQVIETLIPEIKSTKVFTE